MLRNYETYDWFTLSLLLIFGGLVILKQINVVKYFQFIKLGFSDTYWIKKNKEPHFISTFEILLFVLSNLVVAQFLYLIKYNFDFTWSLDLHPLIEILIIFSVVSVFTTTKYYVEKIINKFLNDSSFLNFYIFYKQMIWSYGLFLGLPFLILSVYLPYNTINFLTLSLLIIGGFYIFNQFIFAYKNRNVLLQNWFYFILYLCTLEIAPYFFLYKIFAVK